MVGEFEDDSGRDEHATLQRRQDVRVLNQNQVQQRGGISDDDHRSLSSDRVPPEPYPTAER
jgi:hypothetical protein